MIGQLGHVSVRAEQDLVTGFAAFNFRANGFNEYAGSWVLGLVWEQDSRGVVLDYINEDFIVAGFDGHKGEHEEPSALLGLYYRHHYSDS